MHWLARKIILAAAAILWLPALADPNLQWVGSTSQFITTVGRIPSRDAFIESWHTVSVTTQTYPIASGQTVFLTYTTNRWTSSVTLQMSFDFNTGNNSQWYAVLGPFPEYTDVEYYIRAVGPANQPLYDNNGGQNFEFYARPVPAKDTGAILQWFETDYRTIMLRLPEVVNAGYEAIYLPPPSKGGGGGFSVGYNPMDRFDLGDRMQAGSVPTKYGATEDLQNLIRLAHRFGLKVYIDGVLNHNDNRAGTPIAVYPDLIPEDFHIRSTTDTGNNEMDLNNVPAFGFGTLNHDLVGLADIAHEDGNNTRTGVFTLPAYASFNMWGKPWFVRNAVTPQYYPSFAPSGEDVREYLTRWGWWMGSVIGVDGFRLDAVRHTPPSFFGGPEIGGPGGNLHNGQWNARAHSGDRSGKSFLFGEDVTSDGYELRAYLKSGMNQLDFPLKFNLDNVFNSNGFVNLSNSLANGVGTNSSTGLVYEKGGLSRDTGVRFVQSHDQAPPTSNNLAYAFVLTCIGRPLVYYDGNNVVPGDWGHFPRPGRADALGADSDLLTKLVRTHMQYARGDVVNRHAATNLFIFERQVGGAGVLLVGMNSRGDQANLSANIQTAFSPGARLVDLSGQMPDIVVDASGRATVTVPYNSNGAGNDNNGRGYVLYAQPGPQAIEEAPVVELRNSATQTPYVSTHYTLPRGSHTTHTGGFDAPTVTADRLDIRCKTDAIGVTAAIMLDDGLPMAGRQPLNGTPEGLSDGAVLAEALGNGQFRLNGINLTGLQNGLHRLRVRVFRDTGTGPAVFSEFNQFFYLNRSIGPHAVDGHLTDILGIVALQSRQGASNRLDALYAENDDKFLYLGVAGTIDPGSNFTNGLALFLDTDYNPAAPTGINSLASLADDSGPAGRLLSNSLVTAPSGFGADLAVGVFRRNTLHSSPEAPFVGGMAAAPTVGAQAGLFRINSSNLSILSPRPVRLAFVPRSSSANPPSGVELQIPLSEIYPNGYLGKPLGLVAYLTTTGESGTVLPPSDPTREAKGGRPTPVGYLSNQFLPTQSNIVNAPGATAVTLNNVARYTPKLARVVGTAVSFRALAPTFDSVSNQFVQTVLLTNTTSGVVHAPISIALGNLPGGVTLVGPTGTTLQPPTGQPYVTVMEAGVLLPGRIATFRLRFTAPQAGTIRYSPRVLVGQGIR